jgi:hypothetical protein
MAVTLNTPPAGPNEQIDTVNVSLYCDGIDPVLGVPRPPMNNPETFTINVSTSQGPEPYNTIGLLEKQGLPAGNCYLAFTAVSNTGNTECTGEITVAIVTNETTSSEVVLACIHTPRYGGVRTDGTFNQCAEYRQILVTPTTQSIGNLVDVQTEVYDPDGDPVTVDVTTTGACGNVVGNLGSAASCETVSGCEAVVNTVECTGVGLCEIIVAVSDDGFGSCTGLLPDGSNNNAARRTIAVDCTVASGCGNDQLDPGEDCDPPDGIFCDNNCQFIDNCAPDPCNQSDVCSPEVCTADPGDNSAICTPDPGSAAGDVCSPPAGGICDGQGNCVTCTVDADCEDNNECTDNACVAGVCEFTNDDSNSCSTGGLPGDCNAGVCEGLCTDITCPDAGECVTNVCDPADGSCNPQDDGINTGCDLGGVPGVCDGAGACVQCNMDSQCASGETCVNNICEAPACLYEQDFNQLDISAGDALSADGWLVFGNVFDAAGVFDFGYGPFGAPNGGPGFSAIVDDQGGPDQSPQELSIYNNYDCCQPSSGHFNGTDLSQALVFQEIASIPGTLIGQVLTFTFDAKNGDIQPPTTAQAYIQTLDPSIGFAQTNFIPLDMTNIGTDWATYSITIDLSDPALAGQILQFGFSSTASNFTPSQNVYDNVTFGVEGCGGGGGPGPGPSGNLTTNGDFEAGDTSGWEFFPNDGTFAATMAQANGGLWSGNLIASVPGGGGPPSFPVIKQANIGIGTVQPNSLVDISFDLFGSVSGAGGVFFAEFFSELSGGGTSSSVILGGGPLFPNGTWTTYSFQTTTGNDVSGGVTLQLKTDCGANPGCTVDAFIDNVDVSVP